MATVTPTIFLAQLESRKVRLFIDHFGGLSYTAPQGVMTDRVKAAIRNHRNSLLAILKHRDPDWDLRWLGREADEAAKAMYVEAIRDLYRAALNGALPEVIELKTDHNGLNRLSRRYVLMTVADLRCEREKHGDAWIDIDDNWQRNQDLETAAWWWKANKPGAKGVEKC